MMLNQDPLKTKLEMLECHFTWGLKRDLPDLNDLRERLENDIEYYLGEEGNWLGRLYSLLAYVKYLQGLPEAALASLEEADKTTRKNFDNECEKMLIVPYGDFAWLYYKMGDHTNAQRYLEKLAQIADKFPRASPVILHPELYGEKAWSLLKFSSENYELAKTFFEMALKEQPENKEWHSGYAIVLTRLEGLGTRMSSEQDSIALPQLRLAKQLDPGNAFVTIYLGLKLTEYGYMQEAQELAEQALQKAKDNPQVIRNVVKLFRLHGSLDRAFALLERALQLSPDTCFLKHQLALCCKWKYGIEKQSNRDNREELNSLLSRAIENFNEVLRVQPNYIYIEFDLAEMYAESGDKEIAEEIFMAMFGRLSEMKPKDVQAFYLYYGNFKYYHRESPEEAIALYKEGIKISEPSWAREKCSLRLNKLQTR